MTKNEIISKLVEINAIKLSPSEPFTWASGWLSPIYCDNRKILSYPLVRKLISQGFQNVINTQFSNVDAIAGVATGAIAHGAIVAEALNLPFVYVRSSPKKHGLENLVEGDLKPGQRIVVVEDLISTGKSSLKAVDAIRSAGAEVVGMVAIFTYGFDVAKRNFDEKGVPFFTLADYPQLIDYALNIGMVNPSQMHVLEKWRDNPQVWGR
ncbi:MAG: orotate phosphoribosyltransferase [Bacteroidales bacterium]